MKRQGLQTRMRLKRLKPPKRKKRLRKVSKRKGKSPFKRCEDFWKFLVKERDGWKCLRCGRPRTAVQLHAHHLITKKSVFFRHSPENGICLCASCHKLSSKWSAHETPWKFEKWLKEALPERWAWWEKNRWVAMSSCKLDYDKIADHLEEQIKKL